MMWGKACVYRILSVFIDITNMNQFQKKIIRCHQKKIITVSDTQNLSIT